MDKLWSKTEIAHLKRHASSQSLEELAQKFHTDADTVRQKIEELGLDTSGAPVASDDEAIEQFESALEHLQAGRWKKAAAGFEKVIEQADRRTLIDRARQYLAVCHDRMAPESGDEVDPYDEAVFEKNRGHLDKALELCQAQGDAVKSDERFAYLAASIQALSGNDDLALEHLDRAIELEPKNRVHAYHDPDFESLRGERLTSVIAKERPQAQA